MRGMGQVWRRGSLGKAEDKVKIHERRGISRRETRARRGSISSLMGPEAHQPTLGSPATRMAKRKAMLERGVHRPATPPPQPIKTTKKVGGGHRGEATGSAKISYKLVPKSGRGSGQRYLLGF